MEWKVLEPNGAGRRFPLVSILSSGLVKLVFVGFAFASIDRWEMDDVTLTVAFNELTLARVRPRIVKLLLFCLKEADETTHSRPET